MKNRKLRYFFKFQFVLYSVFLLTAAGWPENASAAMEIAGVSPAADSSLPDTTGSFPEVRSFSSLNLFHPNGLFPELTPAVYSTDNPAAVKPAAFQWPDKVTLHEISGFTCAGLFLAAGTVGAVHFYNMMQQGHEYADSIQFQEGSNDASRSAEIMKIWNDPGNQALRWWHVGLLATGEAFYLFNAVSGISMWSGNDGGTQAKIHQIAFFTHATLMAAQIVLGILETSALQNGQHDLMVGLGTAHIAIGFTIPLVIIAGGVENIITF